MSTFNKQALTIDEQLALLQQRGLRIHDIERSKRYLEVISFFRLTPYMRPFQLPNDDQHGFKEDTEFKQIVDLYAFDRELRLLVMDAIERVEVAVRATINNHMGPKYHKEDNVHFGTHWYLNETHFKRNYRHKRLLKEMEDKLESEQQSLNRDLNGIDRSKTDENVKQTRKENRTRENYPRFYSHNYSDPRLLPGWAMVEELSLGALSRLYKGIARDADRKAIAKRFDTVHEVLESWLHTLTFVRNCCAHHARLWNRELSVPPKLPKGDDWQLPARLPPSQIQPARRIYVVLLLLAHLMNRLSPDSQWHNKVKALFLLHPNVPHLPMGFPTDWQQHPFWA